MATKLLAVLAAVLLVGAFALATLGPENMDLGEALYALNHDVVRVLQAFTHDHAMGWLWDHVARPTLIRPAWLLPASLGLICIGAAATLSSKGAPRSHRKRS
jgi:hypothetical protein